MSTTDGTTLGDRMKMYESSTESSIPHNEFLILRIDGHKFSKFTKGMKRPQDKVLRESMVKTTKALCKEFGAVTGYHQSDEITLVIPPIYKLKTTSTEFPKVHDGDLCTNRETQEQSTVQIEIRYSDMDDRTEIIYFGDDEYENHVVYGFSRHSQHDLQEFKEFNEKYEFKSTKNIENNQIYAGRVQKIVSLVSAFTTMTFNKIFKEEILIQTKDESEYYLNAFSLKEDEIEFNNTLSTYMSKIGCAWFDCRIYGVQSKEEVLNSILFRTRDCVKNSKSLFASTYMNHKSLLNLNGNEKIQKCLKETGHNYNDIDDSFKYGTFVKKELYMKDVHYRDLNYKDRDKFKTPEMPQVQRSRYCTITKQMSTFSEDHVEFVTSSTV